MIISRSINKLDSPQPASDRANFRLSKGASACQTNDMQMLKSLFVIGSLLCAGVAFADDELDLNHAITDLNGLGKLQYARGSIYAVIATQTGVPSSKLIADRRATNLTYGELLVAESIASASGKPVQAIVGEQQKNRSWAFVAKQHKINPGSLTARLHAAGEYLHIAERSFLQQRQMNVNDNYGRMQGNAQALEQRGVLGH